MLLYMLNMLNFLVAVALSYQLISYEYLRYGLYKLFYYIVIPVALGANVAYVINGIIIFINS